MQKGPSVAIADPAPQSHMNSVSESKLNDVNNLMHIENSDKTCDANVIKTLTQRKNVKSLSPMIGHHNKKICYRSYTIKHHETVITIILVCNIPTNNRYAVRGESTQIVSLKINERKSTKIPPIITIDINHSKIKSLMNALYTNVSFQYTLFISPMIQILN